jgi:hypothetical protein
MTAYHELFLGKTICHSTGRADMTRTVEDRASQAANNHAQFSCYVWFSNCRPEDPERWTIVYTHHRDSDLLALSNACVIAREMEPFLESDDILLLHDSHWAIGWIDGYAIRVYCEDGTITEAFRKWCDIQERLEDYPLLDEDDHTSRELEDTLSNIEQAGRRLLKEGVPEDWACAVLIWFDDHDPAAVEPRDGFGGYPSEEQMRAALSALGWLDGE